jgi:DNA repair photolyase
MKPYKHHIGVTSQAAFCSVPLRLDAYGFCQFSCSFCFAKARGGHRATKPVTEANPEAIRKRLVRVSNGQFQSAIDEFLDRRIPIQLGGMTDPFSPWESERKVTLKILSVLAEFDYPTIISTKSTLVAAAEYIDVLRSGNFFVRFSFTGAREALQLQLERGVPSFNERLAAAGRLRQENLAVAARLQPIIPDEEEYLPSIIESMADAGIQQVSAEYLKWPMEKSSDQHKRLSILLPAAEGRYLDLGATRVGREMVLPADWKMRNLSRLKIVAERRGLIFGYAENDLLHLNDFDACCNASDRFLRNANFFSDNILGRLKSNSELKTFEVPADKAWHGKHDILAYLNSHSRIPGGDAPSIKWRRFLFEKWNAPSWRNGPLSYWGIIDSSDRDTNGATIYRFFNEEQ